MMHLSQCCLTEWSVCQVAPSSVHGIRYTTNLLKKRCQLNDAFPTGFFDTAEYTSLPSQFRAKVFKYNQLSETRFQFNDAIPTVLFHSVCGTFPMHF